MSILETALTISFGIVLTNVLIELGAEKAVYKAVKPLLGFANLSPEVGIGTIVRALSPSTGYAVLGEYLNREKAAEKEIIASSLIASFPYHLKKILEFYIPFLLPIFGVLFVFKFTIIRISAALLQSLSGIFYGRFFLEPKEQKPEKQEQKFESNNKNGLKNALSNAMKSIKRIVPVFVAVSLAMDFAIKKGTLAGADVFTGALSHFFGLPGEAVLVITAQAANMPAGYAAAGELFKKGVLSEKQTLITLLIGLIVGAPRVYAQHSLPVAASVFSRKFGIFLVAIKTLTEILTLGVFLALLV